MTADDTPTVNALPGGDGREGHLADGEPCDCLRDVDHGPLFGRRFPHTLDEAEIYVRRQLDAHEDMIYGPSRWDVVRTVLAEYDARASRITELERDLADAQAIVRDLNKHLSGRRPSW